MKKFIYTLVILAFAGIANAQVTQEWVARYGTQNSYDYVSSLVVDGLGNVYVTGESDWDYATIKYNSSGVQQWVAKYNDPSNYGDFATSISVDGSGNVYVTGSSMVSTGNGDYATIKYNSSGVQQWVTRYNGPGNNNDEATSIAVDGSGNVYVTGYSVGSGMDNDYATIKYNSAGVQQWVARYNGPGNGTDLANSISIDGLGNVYVTGYSQGSGLDRDYATIKYNSSGVQQWVARYNGPGNSNDRANSLAVDGSGNVYVTGYSESGTSEDYATIKYNTSGVQQWVARYNGPGNTTDRAYSLAIDGTGNVYVTGYSTGSGTGYDYATIKYNSSGVQQWVARYNGPESSNDRANSLAVDGSGNIYVTGESVGNGTFEDYATIKYNTSGVQQWVTRYNGPGNTPDRAYSLVVDGLGNVYVTGESENDYVTIKYSQQVGIQNISTEIPSAYSLSQNYPNPFNPTTKIRFDIQKSEFRSQNSEVTLKIFDALGREVQTLVNESLKPGTYEATFDGSALNSGVYFYKITAGDFSATKKLILLK